MSFVLMSVASTCPFGPTRSASLNIAKFRRANSCGTGPTLARNGEGTWPSPFLDWIRLG